MTMATGLLPTLIGDLAASVVRLTGVTVPEPELTTYAMAPFGVIATAFGVVPVLITAPACPLVVLTGRTPAPPATSTVSPYRVDARAVPPLTLMTGPAFPVATGTGTTPPDVAT